MQILLGCGHSRDKKLFLEAQGSAWRDLVTVDMNADTGADHVVDLAWDVLPFADDSADEIHAYDVIEHLGAQGDYEALFSQFLDYWRVLKPDGVFFGICPRWETIWAWGDPGHTRVISPATLTFLDQSAYVRECRPGGTARTDYRFCWTGDFEVLWHRPVSDAQWGFALRAVKPSRWVKP